MENMDKRTHCTQMGADKGQTISEWIYEFMTSLFLPKYERKIVKISALTTQGKNPEEIFVRSLGETMNS